MTHHLALRDGTLREIDLRHLQGLVSFPSFHVILSLLFIYAMRGIRFAVPVGIVVNAPIILGTLSAGGHYLIDLPGGAAVTLVAIAAHRLAARRLAALPVVAPVSAPDLAGAAAD
ncbi:MAG: phosphatase PAP2 family protein [Alphaproteobacteria bacterium]|nr:phosphatase PAP2 family protein [Alphaproteobacteria bacterium]